MKATETKFYGWVGRVLDVDLTNTTIKIRDLDEVCADYQHYVGGRGLGVKILYDEVGPHTDPLGPDNVLIFATGPLTGTNVASSGRYCVVTKSPLVCPKTPKVEGKSGAIVDSQSGGDWSEELRHGGFDAIILRGKAERPVYLWLHDGKAEIREAKHLWGKGTYETTVAIKEEIKEPKAKVVCIGIAGEKLAKLANIINDADKPGHGRACGRGGVGAVMGSKNLKAIATRGVGEIKIAKPSEFKGAIRESNAKIRKAPVSGTALPTYGTEVLYNIVNGAGVLPTCNFRWGMLKEAAKASGEALSGEVPPVLKMFTEIEGCCRTCTIKCGRVSKIPEGARPEYITLGEGEGPEYETTWAFGAQCGVIDIAPICEANYLCNELGLDTISTGSTIGCAMELCEKGYMELPRYRAGENPFGDGGLVVDFVKKTAAREGIGDELAEGASRLAAKYGHPELSMCVKGLEFPAYDPRGVLAQGLAYATSNRGGCHVRAYMISAEVLGNYTGLTPPSIPAPTVEYRLSKDGDRAALVSIFENLFAAIDSLGQCLFTVFGIGAEDYAKELSAATGVDYTADDILKVGERVWNLEKLFNIREGFTSDDDRLPARLEETPMPNEIYSGEEKKGLRPPVEVPPHGKIEKQPSAGGTVPIPEMLPLYYEKRGWTSQGMPTAEKRKELGLPL